MKQELPLRGAEKPRFSISRKLLAGAVASSLFIVPSTSAFAAPTDESEAKGQVIDTNLLGLDLLDAATSTAGNKSDAGPNSEKLNLELLKSLKLDLGSLQLPLLNDGNNNGLLDLGSLGALNSYAAAPNSTTAKASAGVVGEDGSIGLDGNGGGKDGNAKLELTALLKQLGLSGLTDKIIDEVSLELGAVASTASKENGKISSDYVLGDADLTVSSPLVGNLTTELGKAVNGVGGVLHKAVGTEGVLGSVLKVLNLDVKIPLVLSLKTSDIVIGVDGLDKALEEVVSGILQGTVKDKNGLVTIDLKTGDINVDLAKLVKDANGADLNGLAPNTELLTAESIGLITDGVAQALGSVVTNLNTSVKNVLNSVELVITAKADLKVVGGLVSADGDIVIKSTLGGLAGVKGAAKPVVSTKLDLGALGIKIPLGDILEPILKGVLEVVKAPAGLLLNEVLDSVEPILTGVLNPVLKTLDPILDEVLSKVVCARQVFETA